MDRLVDQQAFTMATTDAFYRSAELFVLLMGIVWFASPRRVPVGEAEAAGAGGAH